MIEPRQISLHEWTAHHEILSRKGLLAENESLCIPLHCHAEQGDTRLYHLKFDNSPAALALWNLLLTEEQRLHQHRQNGMKIIGTMKDLGTVPILAYSFENLVAFYPDGAWWIPCIKEMKEGLFEIAAQNGLDDSFCPVRAMVGAFLNEQHFPVPDLLTCSVGAVCDDFSAIAQKLEHLGFPIHWWEMPHRRVPESEETPVRLPGGITIPEVQVKLVRKELEHLLALFENLSGTKSDPLKLQALIRYTNTIRRTLNEIRTLTFTAPQAPLGALELLMAEMLIIHYCSDPEQTKRVLDALLAEIQNRIFRRKGVLNEDAVRVFWVNPVADLRAMNLLEDLGGRLCGTDFLFSHSLDPIAEDADPLTALAQTALSDPMIGPVTQRAERICHDMLRFGSEALVISRIPGASHCALEGKLIAGYIHQRIDIPVLEIEVPTLTDSYLPALKTRLEALIETVNSRRKT